MGKNKKKRRAQGVQPWSAAAALPRRRLRRPFPAGGHEETFGDGGSASPANTGSWTEQLAAREARLKRRHQRLRAALHTLMAEEEARMQELAASMDSLLAAQAARQAWLRVRMLEWGC